MSMGQFSTVATGVVRNLQPKLCWSPPTEQGLLQGSPSTLLVAQLASALAAGAVEPLLPGRASMSAREGGAFREPGGGSPQQWVVP